MGAVELPLTSAVYEGDAFELLDRLPDGSVRLVLTDFPYLVGRTNTLERMGRRSIDYNWDHVFDHDGAITKLARTVMPGGSVVIWNDWKKLGLTAEKLLGLGFEVRRNLIWRKKNPFPRNIKRTFVQATEQAIWATKPGEKWVFNKRPSKGYETGIFEYPVQKSAHPTKKPDLLFGELIEILTNADDLVLDPFAGEGTLAYAAELLGRRHISFELDTAYAALAKQRWEKAILAKEAI